jgi:hypothetical protein
MNASRKFETFGISMLLASTAWAGAGSGRVSVEQIQFESRQPSPVENSEARAEIEYNRRWSFGDAISFRFHPFFYGNTSDESWERSATADPRELFVEYSLETIYVRAGYETLKFEGTDGLNPMDIASVKDLGDPLASQTRASGGVHAGYSGENLDFEVMYIPRQTESSLPGEKSPWWPRRISLPLRTEDVEARLPDRVEYSVLPRREENDAMSNNVAARLQYRSRFGDLAIAGFEGASETPALHPILNSTLISANPLVILLLSPVRIVPIDYRRRTGAALYSIPFGSWIFRIASRHDQPLGESTNVPSWSGHTVAGLEKTWEIGSNSVTTILQGSWLHKPTGSGLASLQDVFDQAVLVGLRYPIGESFTLMGSGFSNTKDGAWMAQGSLARRWENGWTVEGSYLGLEGPSGTLLESFSQNDRVSLKVTRSF